MKASIKAWRKSPSHAAGRRQDSERRWYTAAQQVLADAQLSPEVRRFVETSVAAAVAAPPGSGAPRQQPGLSIVPVRSRILQCRTFKLLACVQFAGLQSCNFAELPSLTECDAHDCTPKAHELSGDLAWLSPATNLLRIAAGAAGAAETSAAGTAARPAGPQQPGGTSDARLPAVVAVAVGELLRQTGELWGDSTLDALRQAAQTLSQLDAPVAAGQSEATVVRLAGWACSFAWPFLGLITRVSRVIRGRQCRHERRVER